MNCYSKKQTVIDSLYARFKCHGVPKQVIKDVIESGLKAGLSLEQSEIGARLTLSKHYNFHELFSIQDVMTATGMSEVEVDEAKKKCEDDLIKQGKDPREYFPTVSFPSQLLN